ncbi:MAG: DUF4258 domain-containing protein [Leptospirales bacterium]
MVKQKISDGDYEISLHAEKERYEENILIKDIEECLNTLELLEDYPNDPRGHSFLILGYSDKRPIHIVCGISKALNIRIITVYLPLNPKWLDERTRT